MLGMLGLYLANLIEDNSEELLNAISKGETFNFDGGLLGKGLKKLSGGKIDTNALKIAFAKSQGKNTIGRASVSLGARGLVNYLFNPYVIAAKTMVGMAYDSQKAYRDEQFEKEVFDLPTESDKYMVDEKFMAISNNNFEQMDRVNYTVKQLLNSGNLAGSMIDRAFGNL